MSTPLHQNIRIGNIELRKGAEFVLWYPNIHYNTQEKLLKEGYKRKSNYLVKDNHSMDMSCFEGEESCYVFARLSPDDEGEYKLVTVGNRLIKLEEKEFNNFRRVYKTFLEILNN